MSGPRIVESAREDVTATEYDVVVVGGGIVGALIAKRVSRAGHSVLVLEAGTGRASTYWGYLDDLSSFYGSLSKDPEAPYPFDPDAPQPSVLDIAEPPSDTGYFVQNGPLPFGSTYARTFGGTTLHWLGTCLRMLPEDFELRSRFGHGRDWPIGYDDVAPWYAEAEYELGVAADVEDQAYLGITFPPGYVYPMHRIPQSVVDRTWTRGVGAMTVPVGGRPYPVVVSSTPQARNSTPNPRARNGPYAPVGAPGGYGLGERCEGNSSCVPICPVQAKYNAVKTWDAVDSERVTMAVQSVASRIRYDAATGRVSGIEFQTYADPDSPDHVTRVARGRVYVLAAHSIENAKLLLASGAAPTSGEVGRNLMDHPVLLMWGLMPERVWSARGPLSTSGIESMRGGAFRSESAAFRIELGNDGWLWPTGGLPTLAVESVDRHNLFGAALRARVADEGPRQFRIGFLMEQLPDPGNRVTVDPRYRDPLGNYRPVIDYDVTAYTRAGLKQAHEVGRLLFQRLGAANFTRYPSDDPAYLTYDGEGYVVRGAGHSVGTHVMGTAPSNSVVDRHQRCWDHPNLFLSGCGNFPTIATSNPTLTAAALALSCAASVLRDLATR